MPESATFSSRLKLTGKVVIVEKGHFNYIYIYLYIHCYYELFNYIKIFYRWES